MTDVLRQITQAIETHDLFVPGDGVVVGVSGGPDSLCLLHILLRLRETYRLRLYVAHLNHGARGAEADADAEFVAAIAAEWDLPVTVEKQDVPALAREQKLAFEEAARRARYTFLARVAQDAGARKIAVGHNADDQAETVLMHFLRGTGMAGLRGMLPITAITDYRLSVVSTQYSVVSSQARGHPVIVRPLLTVPRAAIEAYCADHDLAPRFDRSNLDTTFFRNRLRHELLPLLETCNPNIRDRLCRTAAVAAADYELLVQLRERAWAEVAEEQGEAIVFDRAAWRALPVALQRATLRQATYRLRRTLRDVTFVHVENARQIGLQGETGAQATLPMGLALIVGYDTLTVGDAGDAGPPPDEPLLWSAEPLPVQMPGATPLPQSEWVLQVKTRSVEQWDAAQIGANTDPWTAYLDADALAGPLALRPRRRGERFCPQGMEGHSVKVSALMINLKIPQAWRDHAPLLVAGDEIVWVCGRRVGSAAIVGHETERVARLRFVRTCL